MSKKDFKFVKYKIAFKPDRLIMTVEDSTKITNESILYKSILCLNMMGQGAFYFQSSNKTILFYFKSTVPENAVRWYKVLMASLHKHSENKNDIKNVDIGQNFGLLHWGEKTLEYNYNYKMEAADKKDVRSGFNADVAEIWISDDDANSK